MIEVLYQIFYELELQPGWTLAILLTVGVGTPSLAIAALDFARRRVRQDYPNLEVERIKGEIVTGNEN